MAGRAPSPDKDELKQPVLARRAANRRSTLKSGRTIGEQREKLETANERMIARQKDKRQKRLRVFFVSFGFVALAAVLVGAYLLLIDRSGENQLKNKPEAYVYQPTIEIVDEDATAAEGKITSRMQEYIGQAEADFRSLGNQPAKAVLPTNTIREVDFYLDCHPGFIKMVIDRGTAVSVEDADRMLRYLADQGITDFQYIDVRLPYKAYWK